MNNEIIEWLRSGPGWMRFAVELQLLDKKPNVKPALEDSAIQQVIHRLKDDRTGIPALKTLNVAYRNPGNAYWDLFFLADIGLTARDLQIEKEIETIFNLQRPDGTFVTGREVSPDYFCMSAILLSSVARMGYRDHPALRKYIEAILTAQRFDGGWHCNSSDRWDTASCPQDNLNVLMLLANYEQYRNDSRFNGAIDLLLGHWASKESMDGFGVGKRFSSLKYPAVKYGILRVLDVVSLYPYALDKKDFKNMLEFVRGKSSDGKYFAESPEAAYSDFDFGQDKEPSRWITFLVQRIQKRASEHS
jgi:hypothetical protein